MWINCLFWRFAVILKGVPHPCHMFETCLKLGLKLGLKFGVWNWFETDLKFGLTPVLFSKPLTKINIHIYIYIYIYIYIWPDPEISVFKKYLMSWFLEFRQNCNDSVENYVFVKNDGVVFTKTSRSLTKCIGLHENVRLNEMECRKCRNRMPKTRGRTMG